MARAPWPFAWLGLATLSLILLQGSLYWLDKRRTLGRPRSASTRVAVLRTMYIATAVLLTIFPVSILLAALTAPILFRPGDLLFGAAWYLFAVGEAVHYFVFKINMRPREWRQALQQRRPIAARLRRELRLAQLELSREEARD